MLAPVHTSRLQDDILQKERLDHLRQLLQVACQGRARGGGEEEPSAPNEFDVLLCGGGSRDSGVLRGMMRRLGVDCHPSENHTEMEMRRRIKQLQTRRNAASVLIDELEQEVVGLNSLLAVQAPVGPVRWPQASPDDESCCLEELVPATLCGQASRGEVAPLLPPGPELRCDLREQLRSWSSFATSSTQLNRWVRPPGNLSSKSSRTLNRRPPCWTGAEPCWPSPEARRGGP